MAASNYSVNIKLDTKAARTSLQALEKRINTLRQNLNKPLKIDPKVSKVQKEITKSKNNAVRADTQAANLQRRIQGIRNNIFKLDLKGAKVSQIKSKLTRANTQAEAKKFDLSKKNIALALKELEILKKQTIEVGKQSTGRTRNTFQFPMGASSPLNFGPGGQLLPGPGGRRGFDFQSALISGGFPLLFGQGPLSVLRVHWVVVSVECLGRWEVLLEV